MKLRPDNIPSMPFVPVLLVTVAAILTASTLTVPLWVYAVVCAVSIAAGLVWHRHNASWIYVAAAIFFFTASMFEVSRTREILPKDTAIVAALRITDNPVRSGSWDRCTAIVERFKLLSDTTWTMAGEKTIARFDSLFHVSAGDRVIATARTTHIGDTVDYGGYVRLMKLRGYGSALRVGRHDDFELLEGKATGARYLSARMQSAANERLERLNMDGDAMGVVKGMGIGIRAEIDTQTLNSYNITGAAHLLSVSGLHVGIVLMLVNALLYVFPLFRNGHRIRGVVAVGAIWLYAMMTGLSAPVIRAAMMFTGVQIAVSMSRPGGGLNVLLGTAVIMLWLNPNYLFDVSFQMSYAAMAGIFLLYGPFYSLVRSRLRPVNILWGIVLIGVAASVATIPVVSYYFGRISIVGIFLNPVVVITANIIVFFSILWIVLPIGFLGGLFSWLLGSAGRFQNDVIDYAASLPWASAQVRLSGWEVALAYAVLIVAAVWINLTVAKHGEKREYLLGTDDD